MILEKTSSNVTMHNPPFTESAFEEIWTPVLDPGPPGRPLEKLGFKFWRVPPGYLTSN
jgi:hypothetical protein